MLTHPRQKPGEYWSRDSLIKLGTIYKCEPFEQQHYTVKCDVPDVDDQITSLPYTIRPSRSRRPKHHQRGNRKLQLELSFSGRSTDFSNGNWLSPCTTRTIQHRGFLLKHIPDTPQSLPPTASALDSGSLSNSQLHLFTSDIDWTFITHTQTENTMQSPSSEPETWIFLSDDS